MVYVQGDFVASAVGGWRDAGEVEGGGEGGGEEEEGAVGY